MTKANGKPRINSRAKGGRIERMAVALLKSFGFENTRRTAQHSGKGGHAADIVCGELPHVHLEVKGVRGLDIGTKLMSSAMVQAYGDAARGKVPVVLWYAGRRGWFATWHTAPWGEITVEASGSLFTTINDEQDKRLKCLNIGSIA